MRPIRRHGGDLLAGKRFKPSAVLTAIFLQQLLLSRIVSLLVGAQPHLLTQDRAVTGASHTASHAGNIRITGRHLAMGASVTEGDDNDSSGGRFDDSEGMESAWAETSTRSAESSRRDSEPVSSRSEKSSEQRPRSPKGDRSEYSLQDVPHSIAEGAREGHTWSLTDLNIVDVEPRPAQEDGSRQPLPCGFTWTCFQDIESAPSSQSLEPPTGPTMALPESITSQPTQSPKPRVEEARQQGVGDMPPNSRPPAPRETRDSGSAPLTDLQENRTAPDHTVPSDGVPMEEPLDRRTTGLQRPEPMTTAPPSMPNVPPPFPPVPAIPSQLPESPWQLPEQRDAPGKLDQHQAINPVEQPGNSESTLTTKQTVQWPAGNAPDSATHDPTLQNGAALLNITTTETVQWPAGRPADNAPGIGPTSSQPESPSPLLPSPSWTTQPPDEARVVRSSTPPVSSTVQPDGERHVGTSSPPPHREGQASQPAMPAPTTGRSTVISQPTEPQDSPTESARVPSRPAAADQPPLPEALFDVVPSTEEPLVNDPLPTSRPTQPDGSEGGGVLNTVARLKVSEQTVQDSLLPGAETAPQRQPAPAAPAPSSPSHTGPESWPPGTVALSPSLPATVFSASNRTKATLPDVPMDEPPQNGFSGPPIPDGGRPLHPADGGPSNSTPHTVEGATVPHFMQATDNVKDTGWNMPGELTSAAALQAPTGVPDLLGRQGLTDWVIAMAVMILTGIPLIGFPVSRLLIDYVSQQ